MNDENVDTTAKTDEDFAAAVESGDQDRVIPIDPVDARTKSAEQIATEAQYQPRPSEPVEWRDTSQDAAPIDGALATEPHLQEDAKPDFEPTRNDDSETSLDSDSTGAFPVTEVKEDGDAR